MPRCPSCFSPMTRVEEENLHWASCANCFGMWIGNICLLRRLRADVETPPAKSGAEEVSLADLAQTVDASNTRQTLHCPECGKPMAKDRIHPMIPVDIDRCKPCDSVWLDAGEMELLRRLYRELMISDDPEIQERRDKIGAMMAQWDARKGHLTDGGPPIDGEVGAIVKGGMDVLSFLLTGRW